MLGFSQPEIMHRSAVACTNTGGFANYLVPFSFLDL